MSTNKKTKNSNHKKIKVSFIRLIVLIIFVLVIGRVIFGLIFRNPNTEIVKQGNIELTEQTTGYIVLDETVIYSPATGELNKLVKEGTRTKKDVCIASVTKDDNIDQYKENVATLDSEIKKIEENSDNNNLFENDINNIDNSIENKLNQVFDESISGSIENIPKIKEELNVLLSKKKIISGQTGFSASNIESKNEQKEVYQNYINSSLIHIPTSVSGIVSYNIDGFENLINIKSLENIRPKDIQGLNNTKVDNSSYAIAGKPVVKIINNFEWYIICVLNKSKISPLKENDTIYLEFGDNSRAIAKVNNINIQDNNDKAVVVFRLTNKLEDYYNNRKIDIKIIKRNFEGIKVPLSSIIKKDNKTDGVLLINNGVTTFTPVDIIGSDNEYAIIPIKNQLSDKRGLSVYDEIVIKPLNIKEGVLVK